MKPPCVCRRSLQAGIALLVSLLMLIIILLLGISAARISLQSEKAARNDRDRRIALQAAEAALLDAELDIQSSPAPQGRSRIFADGSSEGFPARDCERGMSNPYLGLCAGSGDDGTSVWVNVDFLDSTENAATVPYGRFTGRGFPAGGGPLPTGPPRYLIEILSGDKHEFFYRITAVGFGMRRATQVMLQSHYRKRPPWASASDKRYGRVGWREIINLNELRNETSSE